MKKTLKFVSLILFLCAGHQTLAIQTQINKVTDLFDKHIEDKDALLQNMKQQNDNAMEQIKSRKHHDSIEGIDGAEGKANELNSIKETDLDEAGRQKRGSQEYQFYDENELEPDYTKSGNRMHKLDAEDIVKTTENKMLEIGADLIKRLIELGFNCKTVKGAIHKDPTYYIDIKREDQKNTEYDQFLCEEPRNQYNCNDSLSLNCAQWGMNWNIDKDIIINHREIEGRPKQRLSGYYWFTLAMRWGSIGEYEYRYFANNEKNLNELKSEIAKRIGIDESQIHVPPQELILDTLAYALDFSRSVNVVDVKFAPHHLDSFSYRFTYKLGTKICTQWAEDWTERCVLK